MDDSYIISFINGSSGRFVKFILYSLLTDYKEEIRMNKENSAHLENFYTGGSEAHKFDKGGDHDTGKIVGESIFSLLEFDSDLPKGTPKIFQTHQYPQFDIIQKRLPNTKLIMISVDEDDWIEVVGNTVYKNGISMLIRNNNSEYLAERELNYMPWLKNIYMKVLGVDLDLPFKFDIKETEKIVNYIHSLWKQYKLDNITTSSFVNQIENFEKYPNLTIINYKDLYKKTSNGSYVALEKLEKLSNTVANTQTFKNYEKYVIGRDRFIQESMPWLLKEKPNN